jgi:uncharacterized Zn-finger protein
MPDMNAQRSMSERKKYTVSRKDLPLSCPTREMELWNMHPRVYLPIEETGHAVCPYCGAEFELTD